MENTKTEQLISKRRNTRKLAICVLYDLDINKNYNFDELDENELVENAINDVLVMSETEFLSDEFKTLFDLDFLKELVHKAHVEIENIDNIISSSLVKYTIDRLSYVDRAIIRVSTAEMLIGITPKNIIIDEAIEITKELSDIDNLSQVKFNNRLLDNIARNVYGK